MKKSLIALAFDTLGLGIAEFVMMGILPDVAKDLGISIPVAGHFISAYALGVCVGAPVLTLARKYPLKHILLVLVTLIMIGNICAALSPNYWVLLAARFISGLPHGAYFGVSSRPREFHPQPLSEPYVKVSLHTALRIQIISFDVHRVHILLANDKTDWVLSELYRLTNNEQI